MTAPHTKHALFLFATRGFNFATKKTNLDTPETLPRSISFLVIAIYSRLSAANLLLTASCQQQIRY